MPQLFPHNFKVHNQCLAANSKMSLRPHIFRITKVTNSIIQLPILILTRKWLIRFQDTNHFRVLLKKIKWMLIRILSSPHKIWLSHLNSAKVVKNQAKIIELLHKSQRKIAISTTIVTMALTENLMEIMLTKINHKNLIKLKIIINPSQSKILALINKCQSNK